MNTVTIEHKCKNFKEREVLSLTNNQLKRFNAIIDNFIDEIEESPELDGSDD